MPREGSEIGSDDGKDTRVEFPRSTELPELDGALEFQVVDWFVPENDKSKQRREQEARRLNGGWQRPDVPKAPLEYEIFMFGVTESGATVTVKVTGFQPYFYIKVPNSWTKADKDKLQELLFMEAPMKTFRGDTYMAAPIKKSLKDHLVKLKLIERKDFWGFTNGTDFKFVQIYVKSLRLFNDLKRFFATPSAGLMKLKDMDTVLKSGPSILYESNIDPFLRFIHERGIQPCGWVHIPDGVYTIVDPDEEQRKCEEQYEKALEDIENNQYKNWIQDETPCISRTNYCINAEYTDIYGLSYNKIAPLLIASFDIECTSSHGDFPVAIKDYRKLTVDLIAIARYMQSSSAPSRLTRESLMAWIPAAFKKAVTPFPDKVSAPIMHRLYAKDEVSIANVTKSLDKIVDRVIEIVEAILRAKQRKKAGAADDDAQDSDDEPDDEHPTLSGSAKASALESELTQLLTENLPKLKGDAIIQIGTTVHRYGSDEIIFKHIVTLKSCSEITGALVESHANEADVLRAWKDMIQELDPDIITGYNIFGFDMKYIADRAQELGIYDDFVEGLGRLKGRKSDIEERKLSSSALGDNIMYCFDLDGIVQIDMLKVMQRDHKLDSYKLDSVAGIFIVDSAVIHSATQIRTSNTSIREGNYIKIEGATKMRILSIEGEIVTLDLGSGSGGTDDDDNILPAAASASLPGNIGDKVKWGLVKDDISPNQIFAKQKGSADDRMEIAKYCLQDCALVNKLLHKLKVLENNIGMGNVCYVPLSYLFMRGQGVKIFSLVARECRLKKHLIPLIKSARDVLNDDEVGYEGAIVLPPQEGMYLEDPITVLDYSSLYPSSMISRNISHDALVMDPAYREQAEKAGTGITFHDITFDEYEGHGDKKKIKGQKTCTFAQLPDGKKGIIPSILQMLLTQRKNTRKKIEYQTLTQRSGEEIVGLVSESADGELYTVLDVDSGAKTTIAKSDVVDTRDTFNEFEKAVLDARQLAYKITANSLYGQTGSRVSPIFLLEVAACTTATGREMIMLAKGFVEREYNAHVIYGDSVSGDTPLLVRDKNGVVDVKTIECMSKDWVEYENFRPWDERLTEKEQTAFEGEVWANGKWAKVIRVIRHKVNKKMYRVNTFQGCVDVTEDHSLVGIHGDKIKPGECVIGKTEILHTYPSEFVEVPLMLPRYLKESANMANIVEGEMYECTKCEDLLASDMFYYSKKGTRQTHCKLCIKKRACERMGKEFNGKVAQKVLEYDVPARAVCKEEAWVMGFFFGDGSCGNYENIKKQSWALNNQNLDYLNTAKNYLHQVEPSEIVTFKILDTLKSSGVYKLVACGSMAYMVEKYRALFYDKDKFKRVPDIILNASEEVRKWFLQGYLSADGGKADMKKNLVNFCCKGKIGSMGLYYIVKSLGYKNLRVNIQEYKPNIYWIRTLTDTVYCAALTNKIMKIHELPEVAEGEFVYDIETSEGKFGGGVGEITLLNTDSLFLKFPNDNKKGLEALPLAIAAGQKAAKEIKPYLPPPQSLEYEKTLWPFILFSKKRYVGNLYEDDHLKKPKQKSMGIVLKRRDNAPIVKVIYGGVIDILMKGGSISTSVEFLKKSLKDLVDGKVPLDKLIISKTLKSDYKDPTKIAHKVLADRIGERDPGNKPMVNDRIPFVYIKLSPAEAAAATLQGDRIEHPDFIRANGLQPDYQFYITNQLLKPITQLYALCVAQLPGYSMVPNYWEQIDIELEGTAMYADDKKRKTRIGNLKMKEVKELLFDEFIVTTPKVRKTPKRTAKPLASAQAFAELVKESGDASYYKMEIDSKEKKRGKNPEYTCTVVLKECSKANDIELERIAWTLESDFKGKKVDCLRMATMAAVNKFAEDAAASAAAESNGATSTGPILMIAQDKTFIRTWKNAIMANGAGAGFEEARRNRDDGLLQEQNEEAKFSGLVHVRSWLNYVIQ
jgi:DNA polymerase elongation subunit (family B)